MNIRRQRAHAQRLRIPIASRGHNYFHRKIGNSARRGRDHERLGVHGSFGDMDPRPFVR
jgi:hypothetical protein